MHCAHTATRARTPKTLGCLHAGTHRPPRTRTPGCARTQTRRRPRAQPPPLRARPGRRLSRGSRPLVRVTSPRLALLRAGGWRLRAAGAAGLAFAEWWLWEFLEECLQCTCSPSPAESCSLELRGPFRDRLQLPPQICHFTSRGGIHRPSVFLSKDRPTAK